MTNRRRHNRDTESVTVRLRDEGSGEFCQVLTVDVSQSGLQVVLPKGAFAQHKQGDTIPFELDAKGNTLEGLVRVVRRSEGGHALGLEFLEPPPIESLPLAAIQEPEEDPEELSDASVLENAFNRVENDRGQPGG